MKSWTMWVVIALMMVVYATTAVAQSDQDIYAEVDRIFGEAEEAVSENLAKFISANEKPFESARNEMAELISQLNKDGRSQLATSLQKRLNGLEDTIQKKVSLKVPVVQPKKSLLERLQGKWNRAEGSEYLLKEDGTAEQWLTREKRLYTTGSYRPMANGAVEVLWQTGHRWQGQIVGEEWIAFIETLNGKAIGDGIVLIRQK